LITKEGIEMYFRKLVKGYWYTVLDSEGRPVLDKEGKEVKQWARGGILCVHTSNRYVDLVPVVADVAASLGFASKRGHDSAPDNPTNEDGGRGANLQMTPNQKG